MHTPTLFNKMIFAGVLLAATTFYNTAAFAEDTTAQKKVPPPAKVVKPVDPSALSAEQREKFRNIMKEMYENMRSGKELHDEIQDLAQSKTYDEKQVRALIQKHHKAAEENMVKASRDMHEFYKTLSPEQKKKLDEMKDEMKERRRDGAKEHRKEGGEKPSDKTRNKE